VYENKKNAMLVLQTAYKYRYYMKKTYPTDKRVEKQLLNKFKSAVRVF